MLQQHVDRHMIISMFKKKEQDLKDVNNFLRGFLEILCYTCSYNNR